MRWITRQNVHVDRTASAWLIRTYIDPEAEFVFVPAGSDPAALAELGGHTFDMRGAEYGHVGVKCTFETLLERHQLVGDPALVELGRLIRDADVPPSRTRRPEAAGISAAVSGFRRTVADDHDRLGATAPFYDALYAYCRAKVADRPPSQATPRPRLSHSRRVAAHLAEDA